MLTGILKYLNYICYVSSYVQDNEVFPHKKTQHSLTEDPVLQSVEILRNILVKQCLMKIDISNSIAFPSVVEGFFPKLLFDVVWHINAFIMPLFTLPVTCYIRLLFWLLSVPKCKEPLNVL